MWLKIFIYLYVNLSLSIYTLYKNPRPAYLYICWCPKLMVAIWSTLHRQPFDKVWFAWGSILNLDTTIMHQRYLNITKFMLFLEHVQAWSFLVWQPNIAKLATRHHHDRRSSCSLSLSDLTLCMGDQKKQQTTFHYNRHSLNPGCWNLPRYQRNSMFLILWTLHFLESNRFTQTHMAVLCHACTGFHGFANCYCIELVHPRQLVLTSHPIIYIYIFKYIYI